MVESHPRFRFSPSVWWSPVSRSIFPCNQGWVTITQGELDIWNMQFSCLRWSSRWPHQACCSEAANRNRNKSSVKNADRETLSRVHDLPHERVPTAELLFFNMPDDKVQNLKCEQNGTNLNGQIPQLSQEVLHFRQSFIDISGALSQLLSLLVDVLHFHLSVVLQMLVQLILNMLAFDHSWQWFAMIKTQHKFSTDSTQVWPQQKWAKRLTSSQPWADPADQSWAEPVRELANWLWDPHGLSPYFRSIYKQKYVLIQTNSEENQRQMVHLLVFPWCEKVDWELPIWSWCLPNGNQPQCMVWCRPMAGSSNRSRRRQRWLVAWCWSREARTHPAYFHSFLRGESMISHIEMEERRLFLGVW